MIADLRPRVAEGGRGDFRFKAVFSLRRRPTFGGLLLVPEKISVGLGRAVEGFLFGF